MSSILATNYNLIMQQYRLLKSTGSIGSTSEVNAVDKNIVPSNKEEIASTEKQDSDSFKDKLESMANKNNITYSNGPNIKYSGKVKALSDPKVKKIIKESGIDEIVSLASKKFNLPENLIYKVIETESYFNTNCKSSAGAMGLMQLMPFNCTEYGVTNPYDPYQNIMAGTQHLREYIDLFKGDLKLGLAAYNAGPGNVKKYGGVPPFKETQNYIRKILGVEP